MGRLLLFATAALLAAVSASTLAPALASAQQNEVTIIFELTVEGSPPADATFFGQPLVEGAGVQLADPDGDGVYTGSISTETPDAGFRIVQGRGTEETTTGVQPGEPVAGIQDFPAPDVEGGEATLFATVYFDEGGGGGTVSATGVLEKPDVTAYAYGTHAITDESTGAEYALESESVDLDAYVGERVTVSGEPVPGYENGQVEGGPTLLEVASAETAGPAGREATVAFEVTIEGEVPENVSFYVESDAVPGGVICTTDAAANEQAGYPECRGGGETERLEVLITSGEEFDYRMLTSQGSELSQSVVAEGSEVAEDGLVVEATYSFQAPNGEDVNGDGVVDEADDELAAQISDDAQSGIDPDKNPLPITGGAALLVLLAGSGLAAAGYAAHRATR